MYVEYEKTCDGCDCCAGVGEYMAWQEDCLLSGFGPTQEAARADLLREARSTHDELTRLGPSRISRHLADTIPKIEEFLAMESVAG